MITLAGSRLLGMMAGDVLLFILPVIAFKTRSAVQDSAFLYFLIFSLRLMSYPLGGLLSDRPREGSERQVYFYSNLLRMLACLAGFALLRLPGLKGSFGLLIALAAWDGLMSGFSSVSFEAIIPRAVPNELFLKSQGWIQAADQFSVLVGPLGGAFLLTRLGAPQVLLLAALLFGCCAWVMKIFCQSLEETSPESLISSSRFSGVTSTDLRQDLRDSFRALNRAPILLLLALSLLDNFLFGMQGAAAAPLVLGRFGKTEQALGLVYSFAGCVSLIFVLLSPWLIRLTSIRFLWLLSYAIGYAGFIGIGLASHFAGLVLSLALIEASFGIGIYALRLIRTQVIPEEDLGKTLGLLYFLQQSSIPLGGLLIATTPAVNHLPRLIALTSLLCLGITLGLLLWSRRVLRLDELTTSSQSTSIYS